jgi:hypothetical protein
MRHRHLKVVRLLISTSRCLLIEIIKRLLTTTMVLQQILMSATMQHSMYREYFNFDGSNQFGDLECLSVGVFYFLHIPNTPIRPK